MTALGNNYVAQDGDRVWRSNEHAEFPRSFVLRNLRVFTVVGGRVVQIMEVGAFVAACARERFAALKEHYEAGRAQWLSYNGDFYRDKRTFLANHPQFRRGPEANNLDLAVGRSAKIALANSFPRFEANYRVWDAMDGDGNITGSPPYAYPTEEEAPFAPGEDERAATEASMVGAGLRYGWTEI